MGITSPDGLIRRICLNSVIVRMRAGEAANSAGEATLKCGLVLTLVDAPPVQEIPDFAQQIRLERLAI